MGAGAASTTGSDAGTVASGAASGAAAGSIVGPWGTAIGAGVGAGLSLMQASGQASAERDAERQAEIATRMRIQQQEQEFFKKVQIPMEAYNRGLREGTAQQSQAIGALQEGDPRQLLGAIGKVQAVGVDQIAGQTDAMAQQMFELSKLQAQEGMLGADDLAKIYGERAEGAQKAAASAELAKIAAINSAITGATDIVTRIDAGRKEYKKAQNPKGAINTGIKTQEPSSFVDFNTGFSPAGLYSNYNTQQQGTLPGQYSSIFPSVSTPSSTATGPSMSFDPNLFFNKNSFYPSQQ